MPIYAYTSVTSSGILKESTIEAPSEGQARAQLHARGERATGLREVSAGRHTGRGPRVKRPPVDEVAGTIRQLSILIKAGVPLVEGLEGLAEQARSKALHVALKDVAVSVSHGTALSDSFLNHPSVFPNLAVEMARVAEAGGDLSEALGKLADHMETSAEIVRKVKTAMAYPMVVAGISVVTVLVMVAFILPRFMKLFDQMGAKLPWTTKVLMNMSHVLTTRWYVFVVVAVTGFILIKRYAAGPNGRRTLDALFLKIPVAGDILSKIILSRVLATMATLLSSGVPMVKTLETSAAAANNEIVKEALCAAKRDVAEGSAPSQSLRACGVFPPLVLQMVASGEKTGELPRMLEYVCLLYSRETDAKVKSLTSIIEPVMIVMLGLIVGFIAMSVIVPIYSLVGGVK
jgi:type IV pilus assembly protein PilC